MTSGTPHALSVFMQRSLCAALLAVSTLTACREAAERVFTPPRVEFQAADVRGVSLAGGELDVVLRLHNTNPYALTATGARYRVIVGDSTEIGRGSATQPVTVAARDSADVRLPIALSWQALGRAAGGARRGDLISYRVTGEVDVRTPIGTRTVPVDARGRARPPRLTP